MSNTVIVNDTIIQVVLGNDVPASKIVRSDIAQLNITNDTVIVVFNTPLPAPLTGYVPVLGGPLNTTDQWPIDLVAKCVQFSLTQMTIRVSAPPDTGNYFVPWAVLPKWNP